MEVGRVWGNGALSRGEGEGATGVVLAKPAQGHGTPSETPRADDAVRGLPVPHRTPISEPAVESGKKFICGGEKVGGIAVMIMFLDVVNKPVFLGGLTVTTLTTCVKRISACSRFRAAYLVARRRANV